MIWILRTVWLAYLALLTLLLLAPDPWQWLLGHAPTVQTPDRGVHFCAFLLLALLTTATRFRWHSAAIAASLVAYALATESLQALVETRVVDPIDYTENLLGLAAGALLWQFARRLLPTSPPNSKPEA
ncbi:MAG: hypothetical protein ACYC6Y_11920 [Thermoguttaceae bacterium]